ncbi:NUDIX hydrolase [Streptomyces sp. A1136]|uniref:nucleotide triphosphate diphosphatase NUDT15 n=1 Tax=Streptomyces sp. A1136 TaxID=2563102 RepID=UPI00109E4414|nr:NUDIX domain-containing protein [Streptomyces sp. A1136]THA51685.1 NUDIX domain-containing protein [Streptomyces sp. A1136]
MSAASRERPRPVVGVGALVVRADGAVLIGHRIKSGETPSWCLPGGSVEAGETFEEAAVRETAEECGLGDVREARVFTVALHTGGGRTHVTAGVLARVDPSAAAPTTSEPEVFDRWVWAAPDDLPAPLFPASAALLAAWRGEPVPAGWTVYPSDGAVRDHPAVP